MTQYQKPDVRSAWSETAAGGDLTDPGNTYASAGWQIGVKPPRQYFNWVLNYVFAGIRYLCQRGVSTWDVLENYISNDITKGSDGRLYRLIVASSQGQNPVSTPASWAAIATLTMPNGDNSSNVATTAFVHNNYLPVSSPFSSLSGSIQNSQVPLGSVAQWQGSLSISGGQISSPVAQANTILINSGYRTISWNGQSGQPSWLIGSNDGANFLVWNPSNFSVANSALLAGFNLSAAASGSTVALRDGNGYLWAQYLNQASSNNENSIINQVVTTQGSDGFLRKNSLAQLKAAMGTFTLADFPSGTNYYKLPNGKIVQWGQASISGTTFVGFPIAFPNGCQSFTMTPIGNSNQFFLSGAPGPTGVTVTNGTAVVCWTALGN